MKTWGRASCRFYAASLPLRCGMTANQVLLAARDRFGIKPLFYAQVGDTIYVASEIKALFAAGVAARWDHAAVHRRLIMMNLCDETLFQGVRQVPPGHYLLAGRSGIRLVRYWDFDYPREDEPGLELDFPAQVERVRELLVEFSSPAAAR